MFWFIPLAITTAATSAFFSHDPVLKLSIYLLLLLLLLLLKIFLLHATHTHRWLSQSWWWCSNLQSTLPPTKNFPFPQIFDPTSLNAKISRAEATYWRRNPSFIREFWINNWSTTPLQNSRSLGKREKGRN